MTVRDIGVPLTRAQLDRVREVAARVAGIQFTPAKESLVRSRVHRRMRHLGIDDVQRYFARLDDPDVTDELPYLVDALTTNKTAFYREAAHFDVLAELLWRPALTHLRPLKVWSAGCSTGDEPYTIAMSARECFGETAPGRVAVLGTDISARALGRARAATYDSAALGSLPVAWRDRYAEATGDGHLQLSHSVRRLVRFARLNLMAAWPMRGPFDAIFCRNVMIYFSRATQTGLIARFRDLLRPGGLLFVGHSESLTGIEHGLDMVSPAVYRA